MKKLINNPELNSNKENNATKNNAKVNARHKRDSLLHCFQKQAGA
jgi:hypothetical protein